MTQLETNLNYISSLPDDPTITTQALKQQFDMAGNVIKDFINNILEDEILTEISNGTASANGYTDSAISTLQGTVNSLSETVSTLSTTLTNQFNTLKTQLEAQIASAMPDMSTKYGTSGINLASGTTAIFNQLFKINNLVHLFMEDNTYIPNGVNVTVATLPSGYRPSSTLKCMVNLVNNDFTMCTTATIATSGAISIRGIGVDASKLILNATYSV